MLLPKEGLRTTDLLQDCYAEDLDDDGVVFISTKYRDSDLHSGNSQNDPFQLALSKEGRELLRSHPEVLDLLDPSDLRLNMRKRGRQRYGYEVYSFGFWPNEHCVAVKSAFSWQKGPDAIQHLEVAEAFKREGIPIATPLMVTSDVYIYQLKKSNKPLLDLYCKSTEEDEIKSVKALFLEYISVLGWTINKLISRGQWDRVWQIDTRPVNYCILDLDTKNPRERFMVLDPVYTDI